MGTTPLPPPTTPVYIAPLALLLLCNRVYLHYASMRHQRISLELEEWKTLPWMDNLTTKNSMHYLVDILASILGLIEDSDRMQARQRTAPPANQLKREGYHKRLIEVLGELFSWRWDLERFHPHAVFEAAPDRTKNICIDAKGIPMFETIFF